jgi:NADPH:quinone reductase-like Zn-dependent oxidoreductase
MLVSGKVKSMIDKVYPLEETALAIKDLEEGRVKGKVLIAP